ncbi:MAG TPA: hypothetical protein VKU01_30500 [Bryobacteraceae bacterium]|nr:hypothetical protein [Bryobacteraceae bacterium]
MFRSPHRPGIADRIYAILQKYERNPTLFQKFQSPGEFQRAKTWLRLFSGCPAPDAIRQQISREHMAPAVSLLLDSDPDLLNLAATLIPDISEPPRTPENPDRAKIRSAVVAARTEAPPDLRNDTFFLVVKALQDDWRDHLEKQSVKFEELFRQELDQITFSRGKECRNINGPAFDDGGSVAERADTAFLMGLAFSGGGIRSATVCLGVLQGLAQLGLLPWFDYLSTVSGGGYIGSWLSGWIKRFDIHAVAQQLSPCDAAPPGSAPQEPITFLRRFSNYLTPQLGFFSADTWTLLAIWLRNILLNLGIIIPAFVVVLLLPRLLQRMFLFTAHYAWPALGVALVIILFSGRLIARNLQHFRAPQREDSSNPKPGPDGQGAIQKRIIIPLLVSAWCGAAFQFGQNKLLEPHPTIALLITSVVFAIAFWVVGAVAGYKWCYWNEEGRVVRSVTGIQRTAPWLTLGIISLVCGEFAGALFYGLNLAIGDWAHRPEAAFGAFAAMAWAPLLMGVATTLSVVLFLGLTGRAFPDDRREWWSRLGAWLGIYALGWGAWMLLALYGPYLFAWAAHKLPTWLTDTITVGWILTTIAGLTAAKSRNTGGKKSDAASETSSKLEFLIRIAPYAFIGGLLLLTSYASHSLLAFETCGALHSPPEAWGCDTVAMWNFDEAPDFTGYWKLMEHMGSTQWWLLIDIAVAAGIMLLLAWRVDINEFSMHHFYRNRLIRCYLGASNRADRKPNPFTGLDFEDDVPLARFKPKEHLYSGPYPIINTAINLSTGEDLAFQERKASSFVFTPLYSGFHSRDTTDGQERRSYRPTDAYAYPTTGVHLGTAMAISGAAASPNWGYHTSPAMAFLMTIFDVRLGWWIGNPLRDKWRESSPPFNLGYLLCELLGLSNDERGHVYLSDGGHFDNMGLYELVRRRCRFTVLVDGEEDGDFSFEGLGMAIRKCRIDFGVDIDLDLDRLRNLTKERRSETHCVIGDVWYPPSEEAGERLRGTIVYIKSSLTGDEEADVVEYALKNPSFPHQTTGDQFFSESQFESYRKLGHHLALKTFGEDRIAAQTLEERALYIVQLRQTWYAPSAAVQKSFTKQARELQRFWDRLRTTPSLRFLSQQLYPEWRTLMDYANRREESELLPQPIEDDSWLPHTEAEMRAGFYFCAQLIQIMESVYLDLKLDSDSDHPDNRGWMNLFRHWSRSGMFRVTWAVAACTYGARFQSFCRQKLLLDLGEVVIPRDPLRTATEFERKLTRLEQDIINAFRDHFDPDFPDLEVLALQLHINPPGKTNTAKPFEFLFGFALRSRGNLVAYRVRDHLRKMGLGRRALTALVHRPDPVIRDERLVRGQLLGRIASDSDIVSMVEWQRRNLKILLDSELASGKES